MIYRKDAHSFIWSHMRCDTHNTHPCFSPLRSASVRTRWTVRPWTRRKLYRVAAFSKLRAKTTSLRSKGSPPLLKSQKAKRWEEQEIIRVGGGSTEKLSCFYNAVTPGHWSFNFYNSFPFPLLPYHWALRGGVSVRPCSYGKRNTTTSSHRFIWICTNEVVFFRLTKNLI